MQRVLLVMSCISGAACGDSDTPMVQPSPDAGVVEDGGVPLERHHAGGSPTAIAVAGTRAYIGVGPRLAIWDLSATPPSLLGETDPLRGVVRAVAVTGSRAYVAEGVDDSSSIHVFDITDPASPIETADFFVADGLEPSIIRDLATTSERLFVADQEQGVVELDLANPDSPTKLRVVPPTGVTKLAVVGSRLYYARPSLFGGATGGALDLDDSLADLGASPLGNVEGVAFTARGLAVGAGPDGIYVYDLSTPANAIELFHHAEPEGGPFARAISAHDTQAWIPGDSGLHTLDLTTPTAIVHRGPLALETANVNATAASATMVAIVTDRGRLLAFDRATPDQARITDVTLCANCAGVATADATVYLADGAGGMRTGSLASLHARGRSPALLALPGMGGLQSVFEDVAIAGTFAFVADWLYGLRVYDVTDPAAPALVSSLVTGGAPSGVAVQGDRAYLAEGTNGGMLRVLDVSAPAHPVELGGIKTSKAMDVEVRGTIAYVADEALFDTGGLRIFDVSNPAAIRSLAVYDTDCTSARSVALLGDMAVVACGADGFHWVDIANPAAPSRIAITKPPGQHSSAWTVAAWDGHAALGYDRGVMVIRPESTPKLVAKLATSWPVRALSIPSPGRVVAACGAGGVYQWRLAE